MERSIYLIALSFLYAVAFAATDVEKDVTFRLFTSKNKYDYVNVGFELQNLTSAGFDFSKDTKIITHGFLNNGSGMSCIALRDAFLKTQDVNVIILDYKKIASDLLLAAEKKIELVGGHLAKFLDFLMFNGYNRLNLHLLGHSLGGHVVGYGAANAHNGKVGRVSGLDPALMLGIDEPLSPNSAEYVDVIHTCSGTYGTTKSIGTVDFWPNGGDSVQPSCGILGGVTCSHYEAVRFMSRTINDPKRYAARACSSQKDFENGKCNNNEIAYMGIAAAAPAAGDYYITTQDEGDFIN